MPFHAPSMGSGKSLEHLFRSFQPVQRSDILLLRIMSLFSSCTMHRRPSIRYDPSPSSLSFNLMSRSRSPRIIEKDLDLERLAMSPGPSFSPSSSQQRRSIRVILRPGSFVVFLLVILIGREWWKGNLPRRTNNYGKANHHHSRITPLLTKVVKRDALPSWQTNLVSVDGELVRRNPLKPKEGMRFDDQLRLETISRSSRVGDALSLEFVCHYPKDQVDVHCPDAYRVWLVGPSIHSVDYASSSEKVGTDGRRIRVTFDQGVLLDPGDYELFAWPEHYHCDLWNHGNSTEYHRLSVKNAPFQFQVTGDLKPESSALCPASNIPNRGRWISRAHIHPSHSSIRSNHWTWLSTHMIPNRQPGATFYSYIYVDYDCKRPHYSYKSWIDIIKPPSLLFIGDSVSRDLYCLLLYSDLGGTGDDGLGGGDGKMCQWPKDPKGVPHYHTTHKSYSYLLPDSTRSQTAFAWIPKGDADDLEEYLDQHYPDPLQPPTHISFGVALWLATLSPQEYTQRITPAIELIVERFPLAKITVRTSATTVQAIACWDLVGRRSGLEENNLALLRLLKQFPTVAPFNVYSLFNDRPDSSSDGRHYGSIGASWSDRPETGSAEFAVIDQQAFSWLD